MSIKSRGLIRSHGKLKYISISTKPMAINFGRVGIYKEDFPSINYYSCYISTTTRSEATKLGKKETSIRNVNPLRHTTH